MSTEVTTDPSTADAARTAASDTAAAAGDHAKAVASTATDQAQQVAGQAKEQVANVAGEAKAQAHQVLSTATSELSTQLDQRLGAATSTARTTAEELRALAEGRHEDAGRAGDLAHQASQRLEHLADRVDDLGVQGVVEEVTDFARRRPMAFLVGAAAAGLLVGHLARTGKEAAQRSSGGSGSGASAAGGQIGATPTPALPGTAAPAVPAGPFATDPVLTGDPVVAADPLLATEAGVVAEPFGADPASPVNGGAM